MNDPTHGLVVSHYSPYLKDPSLLAFDQRRQQDEKNLQLIFGMDKVPCDTRMREILDPVNFEQLRPAFREVFS